ncbi:MAG: hypothetical protein VB913_01740 [Rhodospirillales bacterium]|jgi:predicted small integral membrane protein
MNPIDLRSKSLLVAVVFLLVPFSNSANAQTKFVFVTPTNTVDTVISEVITRSVIQPSSSFIDKEADL